MKSTNKPTAQTKNPRPQHASGGQMPPYPPQRSNGAQKGSKKLKREHRRNNGVFRNRTIGEILTLLEATILRPLPILTASLAFLIVAIAGPIYLNYLGYTYNYLFSIAALVAGYILGCVFEIIRFALSRRD